MQRRIRGKKKCEQQQTERDHTHDRLRWLNIDQLDVVEWAPADVPIVDSVKALLN